MNLSDGVFKEDGNRILLRPEMMEIEEFKVLWQRKRGTEGDADGRKKKINKKEFSWIFHTVSHKSPYASYPDELRNLQVIASLFGEDSKWKPDADVIAARDKYIELSKSPSIKLLDAAIETINRTTHYLQNVDFTKMTDGKQVFTLKDVLGSLTNIGKVYDSLASLKERVEKEEKQSGVIRKGVEPNRYNM